MRRMAGTNGKPKFLRCNREDEVEDLKIRGTIFQLQPDSLQTVSPITADEWLQPIIQISPLAPNPIVGPDALTLFTLAGQQAPGVVGETAQVLISNHDTVTRTITFPSGWNPSSIVLGPTQQLLVTYRLVTTNPPTYQILTVIDAGSSVPGANGALPNLSEFALTPSVAFDTIVRNASNTLWVPSGTTTGEHVPFLTVTGSITGSGQVSQINVTDAAPTGTNIVHQIQVRNTQTQVAPAFQIFSANVSAPLFGQRGVGTQDIVFRSIIGNGGVQPTGFHCVYDTTGTGVVFYVRSSGACHITLAAGPPVTDLSINAAGEICATVSSVVFKENIINATNTTPINDIQVREFNYIGDNIKQIGAVVEEMEPLIPLNLRPALINYRVNYAYTDADGVFHPMTRDLAHPESINLQGVVFCMLGELQALRARVALLEA